MNHNRSYYNTPCPVCDKIVYYKSISDPHWSNFPKKEFPFYRKFCSKCRKWAHYSCWSPEKKVCFDCLGDGIDAIRNLANNLECDEKYSDTVIFVAASFILGPLEDKISEVTGLSMDFIQPRADRLRVNGIWSEGKVVCDNIDWEDSNQISVMMNLIILCAEGEVLRTLNANPG